MLSQHVSGGPKEYHENFSREFIDVPVEIRTGNLPLEPAYTGFHRHE
jgi:hypothetical protein